MTNNYDAVILHMRILMCKQLCVFILRLVSINIAINILSCVANVLCMELNIKQFAAREIILQIREFNLMKYAIILER